MSVNSAGGIRRDPVDAKLHLVGQMFHDVGRNLDDRTVFHRLGGVAQTLRQWQRRNTIASFEITRPAWLAIEFDHDMNGTVNQNIKRIALRRVGEDGLASFDVLDGRRIVNRYQFRFRPPLDDRRFCRGTR